MEIIDVYRQKSAVHKDAVIYSHRQVHLDHNSQPITS